jgi:6-carboxyhexanoate--CoA ligase
MTGSTPLHSRLETRLADWKGTERALLFGSGYMANVGVIAALCAKDWVIFSDELNHASIIDGCRLSRARVIVYKHNDLADLAEKAQAYRGRSGLIVSDAVFSMDGDIVNLPGLLEIAERYGLYSMLDEAHAAGVIGRTGRGITEYFDTSRKPDILVGTCSKALGSAGGFVCGGSALIEFLLNRARSFIFSTALPAGAAAAALKALEILQNEPERVRRLQENIRLFTERLRDAANSSTAIVPIILGAEQRTLAAAKRLKDAGVYIPAIRYPAVPAGRARLRASLTAGHTPAELAAAADAIVRAVNGRER